MQHRKEAIQRKVDVVDLQGTQCDREALSWIARDDRAMPRPVHRNGFGLSSADDYGLNAQLGLAPAGIGRVALAIASIEALHIKIMDISEGMRHAPRDAVRMCEMREGRHAGNREAQSVECIAGQMQLRIHSGDIEGSMRIARDDRLAGHGMPTVDRPVVGAAKRGFGRHHRRQGFDRRRQIVERGDPASSFDHVPRRGVAAGWPATISGRAGSRVSPRGPGG